MDFDCAVGGVGGFDEVEVLADHVEGAVGGVVGAEEGGVVVAGVLVGGGGGGCVDFDCAVGGVGGFDEVEVLAVAFGQGGGNRGGDQDGARGVRQKPAARCGDE